ncbi:hypothetical protein KUCAC02_031138 [Chaenocephalus aceratus]|uniref:Uncharacterized protein n=1 Tax=Chaenocephalus aceratus TaxID=36190 RepID=A0ACB9XL11_CHAAC|nr:hypothetical protein KUCAC02_031138 [Chaenocephalus aceratus]
MRASGSELGWLTLPYENGWEIVQTVVNGSLFYTYIACKETFNLFISEADADVGTNFRKGQQFRKVATIRS